jgi:pantetheine-phosphate adenylyltransferase
VLNLQEFSGLYGKVVFAGTFDHLHLTSDRMLETKSDRHLVQSYAERHGELEEFLKEESIMERCSIFPIDTVEGGADEMEDIEALVVSDEIKVVRNAFEINDKRVRNGLKRFHIIIIPRVRTPDGRPVSSSRIRDGEEINPEELVY